MRFGVAQARRGWIEKRDVVNTLGLSRLRKLMRR
jgi:DNA polymerase (family 10)